MNNGIFKGWKHLASLDYFELLKDGRLQLVVDDLYDLVDFHTHLGWTFLFAKPIDLIIKTPYVKHNFEPTIKLNLNVYSGQNFYEERPKWTQQDYLSCILYPFKWGKHWTHTLPNLLWEMDALKIEKSVNLCLDTINSTNSKRGSKVFKQEPRMIFYCSVHPRDKRAEYKMKHYINEGATGIKVHPEIQMVPINSKTMIRYIKRWKTISNGLPVLFHSGFNGFEPKIAQKNAAIEKYYDVVDALGNTPCILGHAAMNRFREAAKIAKRYSNVYLEIGGQPPDHIKELLDTVGEDKLLFGSDWPVYPQAIPMAKVLIATENFPDARIKILRNNALQLINKSKTIG